MKCLELICRFEQVAHGDSQVLVVWCDRRVILREKRREHVCACALNADDIDIGHVVVLCMDVSKMLQLCVLCGWREGWTVRKKTKSWAK